MICDVRVCVHAERVQVKMMRACGISVRYACAVNQVRIFEHVALN